VSEVLDDIGTRSGHYLALRVAYDPPCHLQHAQRVVDPPLEMLRSIPGLEIVSHEESDLCCGSAGSYSIAEPELSRAVLDRKVAALLAANPDVVTTGNPGCVMQIGAGLLAAGHDIPVVHPVELLDRSYHPNGQETVAP
jgi:glycolate oxidase iron-sulfur subunit